MDTATKKIVKKLKLLIKVKFKTQKNMAKVMNISERSISCWMKADPLPNLDFLIKLAEHCNVDISYFFNDESNSAILNEDIFNEVFLLGYEFADENNIEINGSYFLGCYDAVINTISKEKMNIKEAFNENKRLILKFVKKR